MKAEINADAEKNILRNEVSNMETVIDDAKESIGTLNSCTEALDESITEAAEQRTKENAEYTEVSGGQQRGS